MKANPNKFQGICLGRPKSQNSTADTDVTLNDGTKIEFQTSVKLLGVHIDHQLNFSSQIADLCRKAGRQLNALRRISRMLNEHSKMCIFKSFIRSNFLYCPLVWHQCGKQNNNKLEKLQERGLRFVFNDTKSTYPQLLQKADLPTLLNNRLQVLATEVFKAVNGLSPVYIQDLFVRKENPYNLRDPYKLQVNLHNSKKYGTNSIKHEGAILWNSLPPEIKGTKTVAEFKRKIKSYSF